MKAEIICVGTELLLGDVINTNAAYIAKELSFLVINCYAQIVVGDNPARLEETFALSAKRADIVIITGGLGPTYDDLTKETIAAYFGKTLKLDKNILQDIEVIFTKRNREMTENNKKQAMIPEGAKVLNNDAGTAPGLIIEGDMTTAILLPGPPREMKAMFEAKVKPYLQQFSQTVLASHTIHLIGIGESAVELILHDYMLEMTNPTIAPYAKEGEMYLRVTASAENKQAAEKLMAPVLQKINELFSKYIYGIDVNSLQEVVLKRLQQRNKKIAIVENVTGGMLVNLLSDLPTGNQYISGLVTPQLAVTDTTDIDKLMLQQLGTWQTQVDAEQIFVLLGYIDKTSRQINQIFSLVYFDGQKLHTETFEAGFGYEFDYNRVRYLAALQAMKFILANIK